MVFKMEISNNAFTMIEVVAVDIDPGDVEVFDFYQLMEVVHHHAVSDSDIEDCSFVRYILQAILVTVIRDAVDDKFIKIVFHPEFG
jgi:hypothetical protein